MTQQGVQATRRWAIEQTRTSARMRFARSLFMLATVLVALSFASRKIDLLPITGMPGLILLTAIFVHDCRLGRNPWLVRGIVERKRATGDARSTRLSIDLQTPECLEMLPDGTLRPVPVPGTEPARSASTLAHTFSVGYRVGYRVFAHCQTADQIVLLTGPDRIGLALV